MVKYDALTALALALLEERYLITHAKLYILTDVEVSLASGLQVEIIPNAGLQAETDVMECLIIARTIVLVEQGTLAIAIDGVIAIVIVARGIEEVYTPVNDSCEQPKSKLIVQSDTCTNLVQRGVVYVLTVERTTGALVDGTIVKDIQPGTYAISVVHAIDSTGME